MIDFVPLPSNPDELTVDMAEALLGKQDVVTHVIFTAVCDHVGMKIYAGAETAA